MPVLFALSILAFVAFLWATISIAGFVRRARRRRNRREEKASEVPSISGDQSVVIARDPIVSLTSAPPPPPPPMDWLEAHIGANPVQTTVGYDLSEDDMPASVDGVALPPLHSTLSSPPPPRPGNPLASIHSDGIH